MYVANLYFSDIQTSPYINVLFNFHSGFKVSPFYQYSQWKIGSDLSRLRHIPQPISFCQRK